MRGSRSRTRSRRAAGAAGAAPVRRGRTSPVPTSPPPASLPRRPAAAPPRAAAVRPPSPHLLRRLPFRVDRRPSLAAGERVFVTQAGHAQLAVVLVAPPEALLVRRHHERGRPFVQPEVR